MEIGEIISSRSSPRSLLPLLRRLEETAKFLDRNFSKGYFMSLENKIITTDQVENRKYWIKEISKLSGNFGVDADKVEQELRGEIQKKGIESLLGHLRLCGVIPEGYGHDTSEEKLYSKYTDIVIHEAFLWMGFSSIVLKERADVADVECVGTHISFVADAKAFRLSRTAKNQKDFKVQAMDNWKHGKQYALLIAPVFQLPSRKSQIYYQASTRSVCIFTYTHLAVLVRYVKIANQQKAQELLRIIFDTVELMTPSKDAVAYWLAINRTLLDFDPKIRHIWKEEKIATEEAIRILRKEALEFLAKERERILKLSREDAIREVLKSRKIDTKIQVIKSVSNNGILEWK